MDEGSGSKVGEMSNSGSVFQLAPTGFADGTEMRCERMWRVIGEVKTFDKSNWN